MSCRGNSRQSGFVLLMLVVMLLVGATAYYTAFFRNDHYRHLSTRAYRTLDRLHELKRQLLTYAVFQPEIFTSDLVSNTVKNLAIEDIPGPGYFPCPDDDGDGSLTGGETACGNPRVMSDDHTGFDYGFLPVYFRTRNFFLKGAAPGQFFYVVADRFVNSSGYYNNATTHRYAPLNPTMSPSEPSSVGTALPVETPPWIELNGMGDYVVLIIAPGSPQVFPDGDVQDRTLAGKAKSIIANYLDRRFDVSGQLIDGGNADGSRFFFNHSAVDSTINDVIVGITFQEWQAAMQRRIKFERNRLCQIGVNAAHWFNAYDSITNPSGSNWRSQSVNGGVLCP